jgi:hypothetical protein
MGKLFSILIALSLIWLSGCDDSKTKTTGDNPKTTGTNMSADTHANNAADKPIADDSQASEPSGTGTDNTNLPAGVKEKPADELPTPDSGDKAAKT